MKPKRGHRPSSKQTGSKSRGRPPMLLVDPTMAAAICENLMIGMPLDLAAEAEGVGRTTVRDWIKQFPDFSERVTRAKAEGAKTLHMMSLSGAKYQQMALAHLERRFPEYYRPPKDPETGAEGGVRIIIEGGLPRRP